LNFNYGKRKKLRLLPFFVPKQFGLPQHNALSINWTVLFTHLHGSVEASARFSCQFARLHFAQKTVALQQSAYLLASKHLYVSQKHLFACSIMPLPFGSRLIR